MEGFRNIRWLLENDLAPEVYMLATVAVAALICWATAEVEACRMPTAEAAVVMVALLAGAALTFLAILAAAFSAIAIPLGP